ncbi:VOC family protein [Henriciella litoralis]|uniref:VOC family protein n=1 Tax=Henriciella litoralis TaxID=568102 RepID=UPI000A00F5DE|nr:VOC family protein [Henriciella litoralis]
MVRLEHANLVVTDIAPTLDFLKAAFPHWRVRGGGKGEWYGKPREWLHFGDDEFYIALSDNGEGAPRDLKGHEPGLAHLAFEVSDLDRTIEKLEAAGYKITNPGAYTEHRRNVYFIDGNNIEFEFVQYLSDDPAEKNRYD